MAVNVDVCRWRMPCLAERCSERARSWVQRDDLPGGRIWFYQRQNRRLVVSGMARKLLGEVVP